MPAAAPGSQPDGNSVIIDAPEGFVVVDTGRHASSLPAEVALIDVGPALRATRVISDSVRREIAGRPLE